MANNPTAKDSKKKVTEAFQDLDAAMALVLEEAPDTQKDAAIQALEDSKGSILDEMDQLIAEENKPKADKNAKTEKAISDAASAAVDITTATYKAVKVFTDPKSNDCDIAAGAMSITASILKGLMVLPVPVPGYKAVTGVLWATVKLAGNILGIFGHKEAKTDYQAIMEKMLTDANSEQSSHAIWQTLNGALNELRTRHYELTLISSRAHSSADIQALRDYGPTPYDFDMLGVDALGQGYMYLENSVDKKNSSGWKNAAETFFRIHQVAAFKVLVMTEAMAYYQMVFGLEASHIHSEIVANSLKKFMGDFIKISEKYLAKPTITTSVITHRLYLMDEFKFTFLVKVYDHMQTTLNGSGADKVFFHSGPSQFRFISKRKGYDLHPDDATRECVRLTTVAGRYPPNDLKRSLAVSYYGKDSNINGGLWLGHTLKSDLDSHFALWATVPENEPNRPPPYYQWTLESMMTDKRVQPPKHVMEEKLYIFFVYPTDQELADNSMWGKKWQFPVKDWEKSPGVRAYLMIGSRAGGGKEQVWCTTGDYVRKVDTNYALYVENQSYGNPGQCLWYFLGEKE